jgi:hypothetical protein
MDTRRGNGRGEVPNECGHLGEGVVEGVFLVARVEPPAEHVDPVTVRQPEASRA